MRHLNKIASLFGFAALCIMGMTSCESGDIYTIDSPDWMAERIDSIANSKGEEEVIMYTVGKTDFSSGWWVDFSHYYQIEEGKTWELDFDLNINPDATNTYKNFALIITNDVNRGGAGYKEYGAIRYDHQPSGNSEWGDYINRDLVTSTLTFDTDTDAGINKLGGRVHLTVDRSNGGLMVKMDNGVVTKIYDQTDPLINLNASDDNTKIRCFLVPEGSYISVVKTNIVSIEDAPDAEPVSLTISGVPGEILIGTVMESLANLKGAVNFASGSSAAAKLSDFSLSFMPDTTSLGAKTLIAVYNKTSKGNNSTSAVVATATFNIVKEISAFTETVVVPTPLQLGELDCSTPWWTAFTENIKVDPKETKVVNFTNYTSGVGNWNNFNIILNKENYAEYAVVRSDNYGWGDGYGACTATGTQGDWATWLAAMNGAKVTTYITNNGDGTADVKAVMYGTDGNTYTQDYIGINTIDPDDFYFRFVVDGSCLVFDHELGTPDCATPWWTAFTTKVKVAPRQICTVRFTNYSSGGGNWNNFNLVLNREDLSEYAVVRADNYGWGDGYSACTATGTQGDWATWLAAMNGAKVTMTIANNGDGTADVKAVMYGTDGNTYTQDYIGINTIDPNNFYFRFVVDGSYLVFE